MTLDYQQLTAVSPDDQVLGAVEKYKAHREYILHRAVSVFLINDSKQLLMQQRSSKKIVGAGLWANTICGNVAFGESYLECAIRRLSQELGIHYIGTSLEKVTLFYYKTKCNDEFGEHELDQVYVGAYSGDVSPNPDEVSHAQWVDLEKLLECISPDADLHETIFEGKHCAPWFVLLMQDKKIRETLYAAI